MDDFSFSEIGLQFIVIIHFSMYKLFCLRPLSEGKNSLIKKNKLFSVVEDFGKLQCLPSLI